MSVGKAMEAERASKTWGSSRQRLFFQELLLELQIRVRPLEHCPEFLIQDFHPGLQQQMRLALDPLHLLLLAEAPADDLVDGGFDKAGADAFATSIALAIVGDEGTIPLNIGVELLASIEGSATWLS
jgi:hypothetical protein